jgi:hypothetical protein
VRQQLRATTVATRHMQFSAVVHRAAVFFLAATTAVAAAAASSGAAPNRGRAPPPTLDAGGVRVVMDALLPRPLSIVLADGTNFSAGVVHAPTAAAAAALGCVSNDTVANVGCWGAGDGGPAADKDVWGTGRDVPQASSAEDCCALCANHSKCAAWTWNGPKGNLYCYGCA